MAIIIRNRPCRFILLPPLGWIKGGAVWHTDPVSPPGSKWGFYYRYRPGTHQLAPIHRYFCKRESCSRQTFSVLPHPFLPCIRYTLCSLLVLIQLANAGETISNIAEILRIRRSTVRRIIRFARKFSDWMNRESQTAPWMPSPRLNPGRFWPLFNRMIS